jgi:hypothetical protein
MMLRSSLTPASDLKPFQTLDVHWAWLRKSLLVEEVKSLRRLNALAAKWQRLESRAQRLHDFIRLGDVTFHFEEAS